MSESLPQENPSEHEVSVTSKHPAQNTAIRSIRNKISIAAGAALIGISSILGPKIYEKVFSSKPLIVTMANKLAVNKEVPEQREFADRFINGMTYGEVDVDINKDGTPESIDYIRADISDLKNPQGELPSHVTFVPVEIQKSELNMPTVRDGYVAEDEFGPGEAYLGKSVDYSVEDLLQMHEHQVQTLNLALEDYGVYVPITNMAGLNSAEVATLTEYFGDEGIDMGESGVPEAYKDQYPTAIGLKVEVKNGYFFDKTEGQYIPDRDSDGRIAGSVHRYDALVLQPN